MFLVLAAWSSSSVPYSWVNPQCSQKLWPLLEVVWCILMAMSASQVACLFHTFFTVSTAATSPGHKRTTHEWTISLLLPVCPGQLDSARSTNSIPNVSAQSDRV